MQAIVSVHSPKAAGTTLLESLCRSFGPDAVLMDYEDDPANPESGFHLDPEGWLERRPRALPKGIRAVHGHFNACKYALLPDAFRLTFLRHPVDNLLSIYAYWRRIPPQPSPLHRYFLTQNLDPAGLARLPLLRRLYTETYFGGFDMRRMDFVGRHEDRPAELERLGRLLGLSLDPELRLNITDADGDSERECFRADAKLMARLTDLLAEDIRFYETYAR